MKLFVHLQIRLESKKIAKFFYFKLRKLQFFFIKVDNKAVDQN